MKGFRTTFVGMFEHQSPDAPDISSIEIPLIQRDYAQGRPDEHAAEVREMFVDTLHAAVTDGPSVGLDFVYGEARDGKFEPLDGQQRLTTLFLLHWYLASRAGRLDLDQAWLKFSYVIRPSARRFCEQLVASDLPVDLNGPPSAWITDQGWYLHMWRFDPTVGAMLVMIDAIAQRFAGTDAQTAWSALLDEDEPAVWFQLLPVSDMGATDELYIKMNSRGKPLTHFEAFKAHLGHVIEHTGRSDAFGARIDGQWTNLLWPYRGGDDIVDDEFMRYFDFLLEICEWREGRVRTDSQTRLERRAEALLGPDNPRHAEHLQFIFDAFDRLPTDSEVGELFLSLFSTTPSPDQVRLFGAATDPNLFLACCRRYGEMRGKTRAFSLTDTQLLYAVLVHLIDGTEDVVHRLRVLRNVNEASEFELRVQNMPTFVIQVSDFMRTGDLSTLATYNQNQVGDEQRKQEFLVAHPDLGPAIAGLEDHPILRGTLASFSLDEHFNARSSTFDDVFGPARWPTLTGALIATGEYQRDQAKSDLHLFGSPTTESVWRSLLVDRGDRVSLAKTGAVVEDLLDELSERGDDMEQGMEAVIASFVANRLDSERLDWRYYLAKYPWMREGRSGIYYGADQVLGYEMTMLRKGVQRSYYRDPYLYAMWRQANSPSEVDDPWFSGYSTTPRWMELSRSGSGIRSIAEGIAFYFGEHHDHAAAEIRASGDWVDRGDEGWLLRIPQRSVGEHLVDTQDRVVIGASLLERLIAAGL